MIININKKLFLDLSTEWKQLFGKYNWYSCTLINIYFEKDSMCDGYEFVATFIGFTLRVRYNTDKALAQFDEWEKESKESYPLSDID